MKALVKYKSGPGGVGIQDVVNPKYHAEKVLVKVSYVGVCGSDVHVWRDTQSWKMKIPVVLGHEFSGVIERVGENVSGFSEGDRVVVETASFICGKCEYCHRGEYNFCPERLGHGALIDGALSEFISVRPGILHKLPNSISLEHASVIEPVCVALHPFISGRGINILPGSKIAIVGPGMIGLCSLQVGLLYSAEVTVFGKESDSKRLDVARKLGAHVINLDSDDYNAADFTDSFDIVVDCSGKSISFKLAMEMIKRRGSIVKIGWGPEPMNYNIDPIVAKAVSVYGSFSHTFNTWEKVIHFMSESKINVEPLISNIYGLDDWENALLDMESGKNIKSVVRLNP